MIAFNEAWDFLKADDDYADNNLFERDERHDGIPRRRMGYSSQEPRIGMNVHEKLDMQDDLDYSNEMPQFARYGGPRGSDDGGKSFKERMRDDFRPRDDYNESDKDYFQAWLNQNMNKITGSIDLANHPDIMRDYDRRHGQIMDEEREAKIAEGVPEMPRPRSAPRPGDPRLRASRRSDAPPRDIFGKAWDFLKADESYTGQPKFGGNQKQPIDMHEYPPGSGNFMTLQDMIMARNADARKNMQANPPQPTSQPKTQQSKRTSGWI